jgi:protein ImuA
LQKTDTGCERIIDSWNKKAIIEQIRNNMIDSSLSLIRLKQRLASLERSHTRPASGLFTLGCDAVDARLDGGLARGGLHELCSEASDQSVSGGFALMLAARAGEGRPIFWVREDRSVRSSGGLYAPGVIALGIDPDRIIQIFAADTVSALRAGADVLASIGGSGAGAGSVVIELSGAAKALDLTASRKLVLAAEKTGAAAFIMRDGTTRFASAASTRWLVRAAPSLLLHAGAPGHPSLNLSLLRHRGGIPPFETFLEWDREQQTFREPALSRPVLPVSERRQMAA